MANNALLIDVMVTFLVTLAPRGPRDGTLFPLISRVVRLTEAFAAPVHAPDFKSRRAELLPRRRLAVLGAYLPIAQRAPSGRELHLVAGRWLHVGDTPALGIRLESMSDLI